MTTSRKESAKIEIAKQILHEGEIYLKETIAATDALERKATVFLSVFVAIATASIGKSYETFSEDGSLTPYTVFFLILSIGTYISSYFFIQALWPRGQYLVGNHPRNLIEELNSQQSYSQEDFILNESKNYQKMIEFNSKHNQKKATYIERGLKILTFTVIASLLAMLLFAVVKCSCLYGR